MHTEQTANFSVRVAGEDLGIGDDGYRRVECADEIFPFGQIHSGFPADGAVDLRHECCRDVNQPNTSQVARRDESGDVTYHASAHCDDHRTAIRACSMQRATHFFDGCQCLRALGIVKQNGRCSARRAECLSNLAAAIFPDARRAQHENSRRTGLLRDHFFQTADCTASGQNSVSTRRGLNGEVLHQFWPRRDRLISE